MTAPQSAFGSSSRTTLRKLVSGPLGATPVVALIATLLIGAGLWWTVPALDRVVRANVAAQLRVTRDASVAAVRLWLGTAQNALGLALSDPSVREPLGRCTTQPHACDFEALSAQVRKHTAALGFRDMLVADRAGHVIAAHGRHRNARQLPHELALAIERMHDGQVTVLPPVLDAGVPRLWLGASVLEHGVRTGVLLLELPLSALDAMLHVARAGQSGETYAFDAHARFISQSRFTAQLRAAGLLNGTSEATLAVELRDPGVDLTKGERAVLPRSAQPLTRMARDAIMGSWGVDTQSYRDYRGVPVVGAWAWLPELGMGVVTEIDHHEAFAATAMLYRIFGGLLGALLATCVALAIGALFVGRLRRRALRAQRMAERYGQYRIVRKLGDGGMGSVYLASHELLKRPAVIKVIRPDRMGHDTIARFEREAQITSTLRHPNSIAIYDYGLTEDGAPFYVMEHLDGIDLDRLVKHFGPLPQERVVYLLRQLCGSLAEAHAAQLIHRDIKPANLFVCRHAGAADLLKVLDFGIARTLEPGQQGATESRTVLGTPAYMAPELFESGQNVSPASDLYAIGCVAYFLLTGQHVFEAVSAHDMGMAHVMERPLPPSARHDGRQGARIDAQLDALVLACLAKRRDGRPHSVTLLRALLDALPCSFHWTESQAETWWQTRAQAVDALQAEHVESDTQRIHDHIRPRRLSAG